MTTEIALFPIPNCVSFPGTVMPLHVFEPRYRAMVKHCVETGMLMGVCHTQKVLGGVKENQSIDEALQSNQASYKPQEIFSAGKCELLETFEDGRMAIRVDFEERYSLIDTKQNLPFTIANCELLEDDALDDEQRQQCEDLQAKILQRLKALTHNIEELDSRIFEAWQKSDPAFFSFEIFSLIQLQADESQQILEIIEPARRLEIILDLLNVYN